MRESLRPLLWFGLCWGAAIALLVALACATARGQCANGRCIAPPLIPTRPAITAPVVSAPTSKAHPAIVRVGHEYGEATDYGTGTIVDRAGGRAYVVSAWHIFRDGWGRGKPFVRFHDGRQAAARILHVDRAYDLAVLEIADPQIEPLQIADEAPIVGERLKMGGYGQGSFRLIDGAVEGYTRTADTATRDTLIAAGANREGDSGGPVLDTRLRIVAVAWGSNGRAVYGTCCPRIRAVLRAVLPPYGLVFGRRPVVAVAPIRTAPLRVAPLAPPIRAPLVPVSPPSAICLPPDVPESTPVDVPIPTPQTSGAELAELRAEIAGLRATIAALTIAPGPPGPAGPQGRPGTSPTPQELAAVLAQKPITVQILDEKGNVKQQTQAGLGGTLRFRLIPVTVEAKPK